MFQVNINRSTPYRFSVSNDIEGQDHIATFRKMVSIHNAEQRLMTRKDPNFQPKFYRVTLCGRLGQNNPNAIKYRKLAKAHRHTPMHFGSHAYQNIALSDAASIDCYLYERR